jgi:hypothetical protein
MKIKENTFLLTHTTFFYATAPLRFSFESFALKHSHEFINNAWDAFHEKMFPPQQTVVESIAAAFLYLIFFPIFGIVALVQVLPIVLAEVVGALLTIVPAIAIAITALPVIALLALGEAIYSLISKSDDDYTESRLVLNNN